MTAEGEPARNPPKGTPEAGAILAETAETAETAVAAIAEELSSGAPVIEVPEPFEAFDAAVDRLFDHLRGRPVIDRVMYTTSELADFSLLWHLLSVANALRSERAFRESRRMTVVLGLESTVVNLGVKTLFKRRRPVPEFVRPHHLRVPLTSSFPSGHASAAFCAAGLLSGGSRRGPIYYGAAVLIATSRVHVKIHHGSDVIAGALLGTTLAALARRVWPIGV
ncbi:MAG: phosphatase PAP2 family protein [Acidimicrobiales bacterium]